MCQPLLHVWHRLVGREKKLTRNNTTSLLTNPLKKRLTCPVLAHLLTLDDYIIIVIIYQCNKSNIKALSCSHVFYTLLSLMYLVDSFITIYHSCYLFTVCLYSACVCHMKMAVALSRSPHSHSHSRVRASLVHRLRCRGKCISCASSPWLASVQYLSSQEQRLTPLLCPSSSSLPLNQMVTCDIFSSNTNLTMKNH